MKQRISFLLACVFLCLTGCRASGAEQTFFAMDTVMSVQVSGRRGPQAGAAAREEARAAARTRVPNKKEPGGSMEEQDMTMTMAAGEASACLLYTSPSPRDS